MKDELIHWIRVFTEGKALVQKNNENYTYTRARVLDMALGFDLMAPQESQHWN